MKVRVAYTAELTAHEWRECVKIAREHGHDYDNKSERELIKRLLHRDGTSAIDSVPRESK